MPSETPFPRSSLSQLADQSLAADGLQEWPADSWEVVKKTDALRCCIPREYGGLGSGSCELLEAYECLSSACLTICFILTQRDAACRRLLASENEQFRDLLPRLAEGATFATVGLSQLTTSRQHGRPVFSAHEDGDDIVLEGTIPWVTAASRADYVVVGATLRDDSRQILILVPTRTPGVQVGEPMSLMALQGSLTTEVECRNVRLDRRWLLAGPDEKVMQGKSGGAGGLQTSALGIGLARGCIQFLKQQSQQREGLRSGAERLERTFNELREQLHRLARCQDESQDKPSPNAMTQLRARVNQLAVQASQATLIAAKGAGFLRDHKAQLWVRQAMFFLVWSCPWPAASATLDYLTFAPVQDCE
ncbi:MAG: acyl-CoA dehydrogenase family protein [Gemmataceae bacterium]